MSSVNDTLFSFMPIRVSSFLKPHSGISEYEIGLGQAPIRALGFLQTALIPSVLHTDMRGLSK